MYETVFSQPQWRRVIWLLCAAPESTEQLILTVLCFTWVDVPPCSDSLWSLAGSRVVWRHGDRQTDTLPRRCGTRGNISFWWRDTWALQGRILWSATLTYKWNFPYESLTPPRLSLSFCFGSILMHSFPSLTVEKRAVENLVERVFMVDSVVRWLSQRRMLISQPRQRLIWLAAVTPSSSSQSAPRLFLPLDCSTAFFSVVLFLSFSPFSIKDCPISLRSSSMHVTSSSILPFQLLVEDSLQRKTTRVQLPQFERHKRLNVSYIHCVLCHKITRRNHHYMHRCTWNPEFTCHGCHFYWYHDIQITTLILFDTLTFYMCLCVPLAYLTAAVKGAHRNSAAAPCLATG